MTYHNDGQPGVPQHHASVQRGLTTRMPFCHERAHRPKRPRPSPGAGVHAHRPPLPVRRTTALYLGTMRMSAQLAVRCRLVPLRVVNAEQFYMPVPPAPPSGGIGSPISA
mmetsp:Transcript_96683/g.133192  ORF Transcript_96683/g.133192 Transcript_96683/m.133192 type:complete len:110 (+) Transcript_96683:368-697(+)